MQEEYQIINENSLDELERSVQKMLDSGWQVIGGLSVYHDSSINFAQTMIKTDEEQS
jgi:hypothetical protein